MGLYDLLCMRVLHRKDWVGLKVHGDLWTTWIRLLWLLHELRWSDNKPISCSQSSWYAPNSPSLLYHQLVSSWHLVELSSTTTRFDIRKEALFPLWIPWDFIILEFILILCNHEMLWYWEVVGWAGPRCWLTRLVFLVTFQQSNWRLLRG